MDPDVPDLDRSFLPVLSEALTRHADRLCAVFGDDRRTYADIDYASARVANALIRDGFEPGQHGAVYSRNSVEAVDDESDEVGERPRCVKTVGVYQPLVADTPKARDDECRFVRGVEIDCDRTLRLPRLDPLRECRSLLFMEPAETVAQE